MLKFNRNYILEIECGDGSLVRIDSRISPITIQFSVNFELLSSANSGTIQIYNLSEETRNRIYKDMYDYKNVRLVKLQAGYGDELYTILFGNISEASSHREEGSTNFTTEIHVFDWSHAYTKANSSQTLSGPLTQKQVINALISDLQKQLPSVARGFISDGFNNTYPSGRAISLSGNTWNRLKTETNNHCFIVNGVVHCLMDDDYIQTDTVFTISADTGLLTTPKRSGQLINLEMLFEPTIHMGQKVNIQSVSMGMFNNTPGGTAASAPFYKVQKLAHHGIISGAASGKCKTTLSVFAGTFSNLSPVTGTFTYNPSALSGVVK